MTDVSLARYKESVRAKLTELTRIFAHAAIGDFSHSIDIPDQDDEFAPLFTGVQLMLNVIRKQLTQLQDLNSNLENKILELNREITRTKIIEDELFRQKEEIRALVENAPDIIARFDRQFRHVYINAAIERETGIPREKYIGKTNQELGMPQKQDAVWRKSIEEVFSTGEERTIEFEFSGPAGNKQYYSRIVPEFAADGTIPYVLGITHDVTELKQAQIQSQYLASIVEYTEDAIIGKTLEGVITSWNKSAQRLYGYTAGEAIGKPVSLLFPPEKQDEFTMILTRIQNGGVIDHLETTRRHKNGKNLEVSLTISPIKDTAGAIIGASIIARDISLRKQAEETLTLRTIEVEREKQKIETVLSSIADGVFAVDTHNTIVLINTIAQQLSGFSREEAVGKPYQDIFRFTYEKDSTKEFPDFIEEVLRSGTGKGPTNHTSLTRKNGIPVSVTLKASPLINEKHSIFGCVVVVRDNSKERALEKAKDEFIAVAAHQLRTPLGLIRWNMEMLFQEKNDGQSLTAKNKMKDIYSSTLRLITLVNDLLNVSRIEQEKVFNKPSLLIVTHALQEVLDELKPEVEKLSIAVSYQEEENIPVLTLDPKQFHEVFFNLLSNAIKYNHAGGTITVHIASKNGRVTITIEDSGIGIPEADQNQLFSKFFRAENAALTHTDGSGLGLFIAKSYITSWGGTINVKSPLSGAGGTQFTIEIPFETYMTPVA